MFAHRIGAAGGKERELPVGDTRAADQLEQPLPEGP